MVGGLSRTKYSRHVEKVGTKSLHLKILVNEMDVSRCILVLDIFIFNHFSSRYLIPSGYSGFDGGPAMDIDQDQKINVVDQTQSKYFVCVKGTEYVNALKPSYDESFF